VCLELLGQQVLDLAGHVDDQARERARLLGDGGVAHEDAESVRLGLDVVEERHPRLLEQLAGMRALKGAADRGEELVHLPVHDDGVQSLLAAEVLVHHRLGDTGGSGDLLDADGLEALVCEECATDGDELLAPFAPRHAHGKSSPA
jgi:hypothetical protein